MIIYRIKYKNSISEVYMPEKANGTTIIFLAGLPSNLYKNQVTLSLVEKGCVVLQPFFSGSFDSSGKFTPEQCVKDIKTFVKMANLKSVKELYYNKQIQFKTKRVVLIGTSFGSSIAVSGASNVVNKVVLLSPVLIYDQKSINKLGISFDFASQMKALLNLLKNAHPLTYRIGNLAAWRKFLLSDSEKFSAVNNLGLLSGKTLIIHGSKDSSVPADVTKKLITSKYNIKAIYPDVGHSISSYDKSTLDTIAKFVTS